MQLYLEVNMYLYQSRTILLNLVTLGVFYFADYRRYFLHVQKEPLFGMTFVILLFPQRNYNDLNHPLASNRIQTNT